MNALMKPRQSYFFSFIGLLLAGCGTIHLGQEHRFLDSASRQIVEVDRSVDETFRQVYGRLLDCVSAYGYRVRGSITRERDAAEISVDSGFGFERTLYLADSVFLIAGLERLAPERTRVTFVSSKPEAKPIAEAAGRWLATGDGPCRA